MSNNNSTLEYLWLCLREPCLITLKDVMSSKAERGYVNNLETLRNALRGTVVRFLRGRLNYYRDDGLPDLYCKEAWPVFCELYRIITSANDVGSSALPPETRAFLFFSKINESHPDLFQQLSKIGEKYQSYVKDFIEKDGEVMYMVRRHTHFMGTACGRIFGFFPYNFRAERILFNDNKDYDKHLRWLDEYLVWLKTHGAECYHKFVIPKVEAIAGCGFMGMSNLEEDEVDYGTYYGEFSYRPYWDSRQLRDTQGVNAWFRRHLNNNQMEGVLYTTAPVRRGKDLCCFWPVKLDADTAWPEGRFIDLAHEYNRNVEYVQDDIWSGHGFDFLTGKDRIALLELALTLLDTNPWTYLHLANEYRELGEPLIYEDIIRRLYCWPRALSQYMPEDMYERIEDEYYDAVREYTSRY